MENTEDPTWNPTPEEEKLWKEVEAFLYPPWEDTGRYRGDIHYTPSVRLIQEFYQWPERRTPEEIVAVPQALAQAKQEEGANWATNREHLMQAIGELKDPTRFSLREVLPSSAYRYRLHRLVHEGVLELHPGYFFGLVSKSGT